MSLPCINASNGLRVSINGNLTLCCMSKEALTDINGEPINASTCIDPVKKALTGRKYFEITEALDKGVRHPNCDRCWAEEDANIVSKRIRDNHAIEYTGDNSLKILELNLGSLCNLKCRICGPWASSRWFRDYKKIMPNDHIDYKKNVLIQNESFFQEIKEFLPTIEKIDMYGGEPFLIKKQWELLQYSVDQGYSTNQILQFNTNGMYFDETKQNILRKFKHTYISVSVDGIEEQYEYQRNPAKWDKLLSNLELFKNLSKESNLVLHVCLTLNTYNIFYLDRFFKFFHEQNILSQVNFLHAPPRWNVTNIPEHIKRIITEKYKDIDISYECNTWIASCIDFMNSKQSDSTSWQEFLETTNTLDELRLEKFQDVFPEFYKIIKNE